MKQVSVKDAPKEVKEYFSNAEKQFQRKTEVIHFRPYKDGGEISKYMLENGVEEKEVVEVKDWK